MLNSKSQAGTEEQQSYEVDVTTSSPNNAKPNVGGSFCRTDKDNNNDDYSCLNFLISPEKVKLKWWQKLYMYPLKWSLELTMVSLMRNANVRSQKTNEFKRNLKFFNPIIKKDFWGDNKIEWVGRNKPLTDDEVEALWKS
jgi:hypothetical protein